MRPTSTLATPSSSRRGPRWLTGTRSWLNGTTPDSRRRAPDDGDERLERSRSGRPSLLGRAYEWLPRGRRARALLAAVVVALVLVALLPGPRPHAAPTFSPVPMSREFSLIADRRRNAFSHGIDPWRLETVPSWIKSQRSDGTWADVDYTSGCDAQRANWPAQEHLQRTLAIAAVSTALRIDTSPMVVEQADTSAGRALRWWLDRDFTTNHDCIARGGTVGSTCDCSTPGLWNTNWFPQTISVPRLVSSICLLRLDRLSPEDQAACDLIVRRSFSRGDYVVRGHGKILGANLINIMQNFITLALYTADEDLLTYALEEAMSAVKFADIVRRDGIHRDGSFLQHTGMLYSGNYGKDALLAFIELETQTTGTPYAADAQERAAITAFVRGSEWLIHGDTETGNEHWDLHAIGRFVAFPTSALTASADINFNVRKLAFATDAFVKADDLSDTIKRLSSNGSMTSANVGRLNGNKAFWAADCMVHRRDDFVASAKLPSARSLVYEAVNGADPYGALVGVGSLFLYSTGAEYRDIQAAWNWHLIPGTTTLLNLPDLTALPKKIKGVREFVGVVSDGLNGLAFMDYADETKPPAFSYRKAFFFLDDVVVVTTSNIKVRPDLEATPVIATLDNRRLSADAQVLVDGAHLAAPLVDMVVEAFTLWHGNTGYLSYAAPFALTLSAGDQTGNWSAISTTDAGLSTVPIFSAYAAVPRDKPFTYAIFPASPRTRVAAEAADPTFAPLDLGTDVTAVAGAGRLAFVLWAKRQTVRVPMSALGSRGAPIGGNANLVLTSAQAAGFLLVLNLARTTITITFADPTKVLPALDFTLRIDGGDRRLACGAAPFCTAVGGGLSLGPSLPVEGFAGQSFTLVVDLL